MSDDTTYSLNIHTLRRAQERFTPTNESPQGPRGSCAPAINLCSCNCNRQFDCVWMLLWFCDCVMGLMPVVCVCVCACVLCTGHAYGHSICHDMSAYHLGCWPSTLRCSDRTLLSKFAQGPGDPEGSVQIIECPHNLTMPYEDHWDALH